MANRNKNPGNTKSQEIQIDVKLRYHQNNTKENPVKKFDGNIRTRMQIQLPDEFHFHVQRHWHRQQLYVVVHEVHCALVPRIGRAFAEVHEIFSHLKKTKDKKKEQENKHNCTILLDIVICWVLIPVYRPPKSSRRHLIAITT